MTTNAPAPTKTSALPPTPPRKSSPEAKWNYIKEGVALLLRGVSKSDISFADYSGVYSVVFDFVTSSYLNGFGCDEAYQQLIDQFEAHIILEYQRLQDQSGKTLLSVYSKKWTPFLAAITLIDRWLAYFNRFWVKRQRDEGRRDVLYVVDLGLKLWFEVVLLPLEQQRKLSSAVLEIFDERDMETPQSTDFHSVQCALQALSMLDIKTNSTQGILPPCVPLLTKNLTNAAKQHYSLRSSQYQPSLPLLQYLLKAVEWLRWEDSRAQRCLDSKMRESLLNACSNALLQRRSDQIMECFKKAYDGALGSAWFGGVGLEPNEDLRCLYDLLTYLPGGLGVLRQTLQNYITTSGLNEISYLRDELQDDLSSKGKLNRDKHYLDLLLGIHHKFSRVCRSINDDGKLAVCVDVACAAVYNHNCLSNSSTYSLPNILVRRIDSLLCGTRLDLESRRDGDVEDLLRNMLLVFRYVEDKDIFRDSYARALALRLLQGQTTSDDNETFMILKMKESEGAEYTQNFQNMIHDVQTSKDITESFQQSIDPESKVTSTTFRAYILRASAWPLARPPSQSNHAVPNFIPQQLTEYISEFEKFYKTRHTGRQLIWLWNYSRNEVQTNWSNSRYILSTTTYQMAVLMAFNTRDACSEAYLEERTNDIPPESLKNVLESLVKSHILFLDRKRREYTLNLGFKSKRVRVNLIPFQKIEDTGLDLGANTNTDTNISQVIKERRYTIQATIVRIMKTRQRMESHALVHEATAQLSNRFLPKTGDIKKAIDNLVEREYLRRDVDISEGGHYYEYIA